MPPASKILHGANALRTLRQRLSNYDRYCALNLTHLWGEAPRIELRHRDSTLDPEKARQWLRFCLRLVDHAVMRNCQAAPCSLANDRRGIAVSDRPSATFGPQTLLFLIGLQLSTSIPPADGLSSIAVLPIGASE
jgi:hypothetical protein